MGPLKSTTSPELFQTCSVKRSESENCIFKFKNLQVSKTLGRSASLPGIWTQFHQHWSKSEANLGREREIPSNLLKFPKVWGVLRPSLESGPNFTNFGAKVKQIWDEKGKSLAICLSFQKFEVFCVPPWNLDPISPFLEQKWSKSGTRKGNP